MLVTAGASNSTAHLQNGSIETGRAVRACEARPGPHAASVAPCTRPPAAHLRPWPSLITCAQALWLSPAGHHRGWAAQRSRSAGQGSRGARRHAAAPTCVHHRVAAGGAKHLEQLRGEGRMAGEECTGRRTRLPTGRQAQVCSGRQAGSVGVPSPAPALAPPDSHPRPPDSWARQTGLQCAAHSIAGQQTVWQCPLDERQRPHPVQASSQACSEHQAASQAGPNPSGASNTPIARYIRAIWAPSWPARCSLTAVPSAFLHASAPVEAGARCWHQNESHYCSLLQHTSCLQRQRRQHQKQSRLHLQIQLSRRGCRGAVACSLGARTSQNTVWLQNTCQGLPAATAGTQDVHSRRRGSRPGMSRSR